MTPEKPPTPGVRELDHGDIDVALLEDAIFRQQPLDVVADLEEGIAERQMSSRSFGGRSWRGNKRDRGCRVDPTTDYHMLRELATLILAGGRWSGIRISGCPEPNSASASKTARP